MEKQHNNPSPDEEAILAKTRTLSDAELLKGGADYVPTEHGPLLEVAKEQIKDMPQEHEKELELGKMIEKYLPISEIFKLESYKSANSSRYSRDREALKKAEIVPSSDGTYILLIDGLPVNLTSVYIGRNGDLVAICIGDQGSEGTPIYYTNVSSRDKSQRIEFH